MKSKKQAFKKKPASDIEAKSHASFTYVQVVASQLAICLDAKEIARKIKSTDTLENYHLAIESLFDTALAVLLIESVEGKRINSDIEEAGRLLKWMKIPEDKRLSMLFPPPPIDYEYRSDEIFLDKPEPKLPQEYTTNQLGSTILSMLRKAFIDVVGNMQKNRGFWLRVGRMQQRGSLSDEFDEGDADEVTDGEG